jgi:hypothetical protein
MVVMWRRRNRLQQKKIIKKSSYSHNVKCSYLTVFVFFFSIIARGARGGKGADGMGISKGATAIAVIELSKHQQLYILVGQEGGDACRKVRLRSTINSLV